MNSPFIQIVSVSRIKRLLRWNGIRAPGRRLSAAPASAARARRDAAAAMWAGDPAPTHTSSCPSSVRSTKTRSTSGSGNGATAPGPEAGCELDLVGLGDARGRAARRERDLRRVRAAVARHEREHRLAFADEHERLHDLGERAAGSARGVLRGRRTGLELLEPRLGTGLSQEGGDSLDRLRPAWLHTAKRTRCRNTNGPLGPARARSRARRRSPHRGSARRARAAGRSRSPAPSAPCRPPSCATRPCSRC